MDHKIKSILNAVVFIGVALWLLGAFGLFNSLSGISIDGDNQLNSEQFGVMLEEPTNFYCTF
jgi:hypothetical protein